MIYCTKSGLQAILKPIPYLPRSYEIRCADANLFARPVVRAYRSTPLAGCRQKRPFLRIRVQADGPVGAPKRPLAIGTVTLSRKFPNLCKPCKDLHSAFLRPNFVRQNYMNIGIIRIKGTRIWKLTFTREEQLYKSQICIIFAEKVVLWKRPVIKL